MMGLQYRDSSSEEEAPTATEVIEIADEDDDDDVMSVDSGWKRSSVSPQQGQGRAGGEGRLLREHLSGSVCVLEFLESPTGISPFFPLVVPINNPTLGKVAGEKPCVGGFPGRDLGWTLFPVLSSFL